MIDQMTLPTAVPDPPRVVPKWFFVRRMQGMFFCGVLLMPLGLVLCVGMVGVFHVLGMGSPLADLQLDCQHEVATAVITDKKLLTDIHMGSDHPWRVGFEHTTSDGASVRAVGFTYDQSFAEKELGETIMVEYDPTQPSRARPVGGSTSAIPLWVYGLVLALIGPESLVGVIMLIMVAMQARSERILLSYGTGAEAEILRVQRVWYLHFGSKHPYDIIYQFYDHRGLEVRGQDRTYHYAWAEALKPGDKVGVVYNPQSPAANVLWLHGGDTRSKLEQ